MVVVVVKAKTMFLSNLLEGWLLELYSGTVPHPATMTVRRALIYLLPAVVSV